MFQFVWITTDILLWFLVISTCVAGFIMRRNEQWRAPWQQVWQSRQGVISGLVLLTFVIIGLLDSIHVRYAIDSLMIVDPPPGDPVMEYYSMPISVLDLLIWPLGQGFEETYSAPFALHLFVKKMVGMIDGQPILDYPPLEWIAEGITTIADRAANIEHIVIFAMIKACGIWLIILTSVWVYQTKKLKDAKLAWRSLWKNVPDRVPTFTFLLTVGVILLIVISLKDLSIAYHIMGTDKIGMDVFYQGIKSIRTGIIMGTVTTLFMLPLAVLGGMLAGYFRGWVDDGVQYIYTTINAIPSVLLIAASVLVLQLYISQHESWFPTVEQRADARLLMLCMILGLTNWTTLCRLLRGETLKLREADYVLAARTLGVPTYLILWRHILPNILPMILVIMVLDFSNFVLIEAVLSYVGVGVDPTTLSWGNMINRARLELAREPMVWWSLATAFVLMFSLVLAANLFADKVRDAFDPRLQKV